MRIENKIIIEKPKRGEVIGTEGEKKNQSIKQANSYFTYVYLDY
jgi:hypothetical protein